MANKIQTDLMQITNSIGRKYWIWGSDSFYVQRLQGGPYQKQNLLYLRSLVPHPRTVLDIGMNIGMNTIEYATFADVVHGFEPVPATYKIAIDNIQDAQQRYCKNKGWYKLDNDEWASLKVSGRISTHNVALGTKFDTVEMQIKQNDGHNRIANDTGEFPTMRGHARKKNTTDKRVTVEQHTLDSYNFENVDIIKVDVEGYELFVLEGAADTIARNRPVVQVECVENQPRTFSHSIQDIMDFFTSRDYVITTCDGVVRPDEWEYVKQKMDRFMIPKERTDLYTK